MTALQIYNTQAREKQLFTPIDANRVTMYVCGPTVYNYVHIGNARPVVVFDTLFRVLESLYPQVVYARNITDIDDKIMKAARENGESINDVTQRFSDAYIEDMSALNAQRPTIEPRATDHIPHMIELVETLMAKGHAYESDSHVLFSVPSMPNYGALTQRKQEDLLDGARVEVASYKRYAGDFILWKPSADDEPGWDSPWGRGRPGWHLECSAMIAAHLGQQIDIHGGGRDLTFPHHENEAAQSCCAYDQEKFVNYWMHNGYVNIDGEKMSKSLGNFRTVRELLGHYKGEVLRFALLSAHYRSELDFSKELLQQAKTVLDGLYTALRDAQTVEAVTADLSGSVFQKALLDDLNTPLAISELHQFAKNLNKADDSEKPMAKALLLQAGQMLGLLQQEPERWFTEAVGDTSDGLTDADIEALIAERAQAKLDKNYGRCDQIRAELLEQGIELQDSKEGTLWRRQ